MFRKKKRSLSVVDSRGTIHEIKPGEGIGIEAVRDGGDTTIRKTVFSWDGEKLLAQRTQGEPFADIKRTGGTFAGVEREN